MWKRKKIRDKYRNVMAHLKQALYYELSIFLTNGMIPFDKEKIVALTRIKMCINHLYKQKEVRQQKKYSM